LSSIGAFRATGLMTAPRESTKKRLRIDRKEIFFLKFIFEAYDGLAVVRTIDPEAGVVMLHIAPGCEAEVEMVLEDLKREILIEPVAD